MLAIIPLKSEQAAYFEFGRPLEPIETLEQRIDAILADYEARRADLYHPFYTGQTMDRLLDLSKLAGDDAAELVPLLKAIGFMGQSLAREAVAARLGHPSRDVRLAALRSLGQLGRWSSLPQILPFLDDADREIRREAIIAAGKCSKEPVPALDRIAGDPQTAAATPEITRLADEARRRIALVAEEKFEEWTRFNFQSDEYEDVLPSLNFIWPSVAAVIEDTAAPEVLRRRAAWLISTGCIRPGAVHLVWLVKRREEESRETRLIAVQGVGRCLRGQAWPILVEVLGEDDRALRQAAIVSLGQLGMYAALEPVVAQWDRADTELRADITRAARRISKVAGTRALEDYFVDGSPGWAPSAGADIAAAERIWLMDDDVLLRGGLGGPGGPEPGALGGPNPARERLWQELQSPDGAARKDAVLLLALHPDPGDRPALEALLDRETDSLVQQIAVRTLNRTRTQ